MARTMSDSQMRYREEQQRKRLNREQEMKKLMEHVYGADYDPIWNNPNHYDDGL